MYKLKSKAQTLASLNLKKSVIPKLYLIDIDKYKKNKKKCFNKISKLFKFSKIAIRSSFESEDTSSTSNAGKYVSFLNIESNNFDKIEQCINKLIKSKKKIKKKEHFFVQKMVYKVKYSGVILTRDLENYSKCININYHKGSKTETVTSGKRNTKQLIYFENSNYKIAKKFKRLYFAVKEIINKFNNIDLDIEFAITTNDKINILQIRKLIIPKKAKLKINAPKKYLDKLSKKIDKLKLKHYGLYGDTTYFGNMPDWNPAEIIGTKPKPLALSLYQELITDHVWSKNRLAYGYEDLSQFHLMTTFFGTPFVDVRIDFNSWLPKNLDKKISKKIIKYYLDKFKKNNSLQDKIEFEILFTCASFTTLNRIKKNLKNILTSREIYIFYKSLKNLNKIALYKKNEDINLISQLIKKQSLIKKSKLYEIDKIYWLVEDCKKYGTLPFAGLARCGFIAIEILNSLKNLNHITEKDKSNFLSNVNTVLIEIKKDYLKLSKVSFLEKYGHLRPGTYEIDVPNYRENYKKYFNNQKKQIHFFPKKVNISNKIKKPLKKIGIYKNPNELIKFMRESIAQREYSKFIFSKSIDLIFENLIKFGRKYNITRDELSYVKISNILDIYFNLSNYETIKNLKKQIIENKKEYLLNQKIKLPDVILSSKDLFCYEKKYDKINFISDKIISSKIIKFNKKKILTNYKGIVLIENADPGYDFLFNKNIKGLITKYGGLNSHMAIRCAEMNLPALIGVGEKNYNNLIQSKTLKIDCVSKKIEKIN